MIVDDKIRVKEIQDVKKYRIDIKLTAIEKTALDFMAKETWHSYWTLYVRRHIYSVFNPIIKTDLNNNTKWLKNRIESIKNDFEKNEKLLKENVNAVLLYKAQQKYTENKKWKIYHELKKKEIDRLEEWIRLNLKGQIKLKKRYYERNKILEKENTDLKHELYQINSKLDDINANYIIIPKTLNIDERWRIEVLKRDNFSCRKCGKPCSSAHHIYSRLYCKKKNPKLEWDLRNGVSLCYDCHHSITVDGRKWFIENK